jgi:hypothetical protein
MGSHVGRDDDGRPTEEARAVHLPYWTSYIFAEQSGEVDGWNYARLIAGYSNPCQHGLLA